MNKSERIQAELHKVTALVGQGEAWLITVTKPSRFFRKSF